jgi:hypothetical protein
VIRRASLVLVLGLIGARALNAQLPEIRGYYLNVPTWSDSAAFAVGGLGDLNRFRLMTKPTYGDFTFQVAYEQLFSWTQNAGGDPGVLFVSVVPGGGEWLDLQWTIENTDHINWAHRFDRLNIQYAPGRLFEFALGRQAISWATTLLFTPADPFVPFDPSDPFREYRAGVDAFRAQMFPSPLSDIDFVVRPTKTRMLGDSVVENLTAALRGRTVWKSWEVSAWAGVLYDEPTAAIGAAGAIGPTAVRTEVELTRDSDTDDLVLRGTLGFDRLVNAWGKDLFLLLEYQHDDFGASGPSEYLTVLQSDAFARGQLQVLGRDEIAAQASYALHPLWGASFLVLWNLNDPSVLVSPAASYSLASDASLSGGIFMGLGDSTGTQEVPIPSEYGIVPVFVYLSVSLFF